MQQVEVANTSQKEVNLISEVSPQNSSTIEPIKVQEDQTNNTLVIQLKEQLRSKIQELVRKDTIISELEQKCQHLHEYEDKIASLQEKTTILQKIIDNLEKAEAGYENDDKNQPIIVEYDQYHIGEQNTLTEHQPNVTSLRTFASKQQSGKQKQNQQPNQGQRKQGGKQTRKSSLKPRDNNPKNNEENVSAPKSRNHARISSEDAQLNIKPEEIVSSKFLHPVKQQSEKNLQIQMKFDKMKENMGNKKPKSNKNIEQIYSILNNYNSRKQQLAIKGINQKLQTILNQSLKLQTSAVKQRDSNQYFCRTDRPTLQNNNMHYNYYPNSRLQKSRQRKDNYSFNNSYLNLNSSIGSTSSRGYHNKTDRIEPNSNSWVAKQISNNVVNISNKLGNQKFNKIMNSYNVEDMLRARRTCSTLNSVGRTSVNRTVGYPSGVNKFQTHMYWQ